MSLHDPSILLSLDRTTLFVVAVCVTGLLGLLLLFVWTQDRIHALAWWGTASLVGGVAVVLWSVENYLSPPLPAGIANAMLFVACGMIWSAARLFHGRPVLWGSMLGGATLWLAAGLSPGFVNSIALFAGLQKVFRPAIVQVLRDPLATAQLGDAVLPVGIAGTSYHHREERRHRIVCRSTP